MIDYKDVISILSIASLIVMQSMGLYLFARKRKKGWDAKIWQIRTLFFSTSIFIGSFILLFLLDSALQQSTYSALQIIVIMVVVQFFSTPAFIYLYFFFKAQKKVKRDSDAGKIIMEKKDI